MYYLRLGKKEIIVGDETPIDKTIINILYYILYTHFI